MTLPVVILAGGLATRMLPLTEQLPKSLLRVGNDYFINHQLRYLSQQGISKVILCLGHLGEQIQQVVGGGENYKLKVQYSWDGPCLLGTGGALKRALPLLDEHFFILYGDSYLPIDFAAVEKQFYAHDKPALMTVFKNKSLWDRSNVVFGQNLVIEYNKKQPSTMMEYIDYGLSIMSASILQNYPVEGSFDLAELFCELAKQRKLLGYEVFERFYEIGSMEGLEEAIARLS
ncbi:Glucose-1-phosphate cytidylyltransferase [Legionella massiliensis]|uniref:Glucose-1-phosphate cytidylyltransferase n=1 Tax=Legionella massiliensis TaxID=1034943 RepID=A0A078KX36_9GAMM|nr:sugar phosphate nucleotidyltransferase [Legionella massiliensis]CDZ77602.1 Glucose-1-phosphate cytidylyltransferase [Legionella massiliensis]CEE13340.1 D-glycero-alpha-D-manno-heptose 1-phosphate guanylyltransferase [Legionella massiliensis]